MLINFIRTYSIRTLLKCDTKSGNLLNPEDKCIPDFTRAAEKPQDPSYHRIVFENIFRALRGGRTVLPGLVLDDD